LQEHIEFGVNLDVTSYIDGKRETHNPVGRAYKPVVWDHYQVYIHSNGKNTTYSEHTLLYPNIYFLCLVLTIFSKLYLRI